MLPSTIQRMNDAAAAVTALQPDHWIKASEDAVSAERFHQRHPLGAKDMINLLVKTLEGKAQETSTIADILIKNPDLDPANFCFKTYEVVTLAVIFRDHPQMHARLVADAKNRCYAEGAEELIKEYDAIMADPSAILEIGKWLCAMDEEERQCGDCTLADTWKAIDWLIAEKHDMICGLFKQYKRIPKWVGADFVWSSQDVENVVGVDEGEDIDKEDMEMMDEKLVNEKTDEEMIDVDVVRENVPSAKTPKPAKNKAGKRKGKKRY